jgi:hypothetical protein
MYLTSQLGEHDAILDPEPSHLYGSMVAEIKQVHHTRTGHLYFTKLWSSVAPSGNIYRHCAMEAERLRHCEDIWQQVRILAKDGQTDKVVKAIQQAPSTVSTESDPTLGFKPLEEFIATETVRYGPLLLPVDPAQRRWRLYVLATTWLVFWLQVTAPAFILIQQSAMLPPHFRDVESIKGAIMHSCLGTTQDALRTMMGVGLLLLIMLILSNYVQMQLECIQKTRYLPLDRFWLCMGNAANIWSSMTTSLAAMVMFWNESTPKDMAMDALTILWFFTLDDFNSYSFNIIMQSDEDFQRNISWLQALLSHCPVHLKDLFDENGDMQWTYDLNGTPLKVGATEICTTRISKINRSSKNVALLDRDIRVDIQRSADEIVTLPHAEINIVLMIWQVSRYLMYVCQFLVPVMWFLMNSDCRQGK